MDNLEKILLNKLNKVKTYTDIYTDKTHGWNPKNSIDLSDVICTRKIDAIFDKITSNNKHPYLSFNESFKAMMIEEFNKHQEVISDLKKEEIESEIKIIEKELKNIEWIKINKELRLEKLNNLNETKQTPLEFGTRLINQLYCDLFAV